MTHPVPSSTSSFDTVQLPVGYGVLDLIAMFGGPRRQFPFRDDLLRVHIMNDTDLVRGSRLREVVIRRLADKYGVCAKWLSCATPLTLLKFARQYFIDCEEAYAGTPTLALG